MMKRRRYEDDNDNVLRTLKDGERMHFSMMTMDSGGEVLSARDAATVLPCALSMHSAIPVLR